MSEVWLAPLTVFTIVLIDRWWFKWRPALRDRRQRKHPHRQFDHKHCYRVHTDTLQCITCGARAGVVRRAIAGMLGIW